LQVIPIISDLQVPFQDEAAVAAVATFIHDRNLDSICVGDVLDAPQISRWSRGNKGEFAGLLDEQREQALTILRDLKVRHLSRSNHDERIERYVKSYAPGLDGLPELTVERFMKLDEINCEYHRQPYRPAPGWLLLHGDEGGMTQVPGSTALGLAKRTNYSIACGHTHRLGLQHYTYATGTTYEKSIWGLETGCLMDASKAAWIGPKVSFNWHRGFGILVVDGDEVHPFAIPIRDGSFWWDGRRWSGC